MSLQDFLKTAERYHYRFFDDNDVKEKYQEFVEYQALPNKLEFESLTVEICRRNINKEIPTYFRNGGLHPGNDLLGPQMVYPVLDRNNPKKVFLTLSSFRMETFKLATMKIR